MPGVAPQPSPGAKYKSPEQPGSSLPRLRAAAQTDDCMLIIMTLGTAASRGKGCWEQSSVQKGRINSPPLPSLPGLGSSRPGGPGSGPAEMNMEGLWVNTEGAPLWWNSCLGPLRWRGATPLPQACTLYTSLSWPQTCARIRRCHLGSLFNPFLGLHVGAAGIPLSLFYR